MSPLCFQSKFATIPTRLGITLKSVKVIMKQTQFLSETRRSGTGVWGGFISGNPRLKRKYGTETCYVVLWQHHHPIAPGGIIKLEWTKMERRQKKERKILMFDFGATRPPLVSSFFVVLWFWIVIVQRQIARREMG